MDPAEAKKRFRTYAPELELLLWAVWNPIGVDVPLDEYESYVPVIWRLLSDGAGVDAVFSELKRICEEQMGGRGGREREAAERLTEWWYWRFDYPVEFEARS